MDNDIRSSSWRAQFNPFRGLRRTELSTTWDQNFIDPVGGEEDLTLIDYYKTNTSFTLFDEYSSNYWSIRMPKYEPDAVGVPCCSTGESEGEFEQITGSMTCAKYDFNVCYEHLVQHFASGDVAAGAEHFERYISEAIPADAGDVARKSEKLFYQGQMLSSSDLHLGIIKYWLDASFLPPNNVPASIPVVSTSDATDLLDGFLYMYNRIPDDASGTKLGEIIFVTSVKVGRILRPLAIDRWPGLGTTLIDRTQDDFSPINLPNVPATIYPVYGLNHDDYNFVIATPRRNIIWLNSRSNSYTTVQSWFSDDDDLLKWRIKLMQGAMIRLIPWTKIFNIDNGLLNALVGVRNKPIA